MSTVLFSPAFVITATSVIAARAHGDQTTTYHQNNLQNLAEGNDADDDIDDILSHHHHTNNHYHNYYADVNDFLPAPLYPLSPSFYPPSSSTFSTSSLSSFSGSSTDTTGGTISSSSSNRNRNKNDFKDGEGGDSDSDSFSFSFFEYEKYSDGGVDVFPGSCLVPSSGGDRLVIIPHSELEAHILRVAPKAEREKKREREQRGRGVAQNNNDEQNMSPTTIQIEQTILFSSSISGDDGDGDGDDDDKVKKEVEIEENKKGGVGGGLSVDVQWHIDEVVYLASDLCVLGHTTKDAAVLSAWLVERTTRRRRRRNRRRRANQSRGIFSFVYDDQKEEEGGGDRNGVNQKKNSGGMTTTTTSTWTQKRRLKKKHKNTEDDKHNEMKTRQQQNLQILKRVGLNPQRAAEAFQGVVYGNRCMNKKDKKAGIMFNALVPWFRAAVRAAAPAVAAGEDESDEEKRSQEKKKMRRGGKSRAMGQQKAAAEGENDEGEDDDEAAAAATTEVDPKTGFKTDGTEYTYDQLLLRRRKTASSASASASASAPDVTVHCYGGIVKREERWRWARTPSQAAVFRRNLLKELSIPSLEGGVKRGLWTSGPNTPPMPYSIVAASAAPPPSHALQKNRNNINPSNSHNKGNDNEQQNQQQINIVKRRYHDFDDNGRHSQQQKQQKIAPTPPDTTHECGWRRPINITVLIRDDDRHFGEEHAAQLIASSYPSWAVSVTAIKFDKAKSSKKKNSKKKKKNNNNHQYTKAGGSGGSQEGFSFYYDPDATPPDYRTQVGILQSTDVLLAAHGAGLANIIAMRAGSAVIEFFPHAFRYNLYEELSIVADVHYQGYESPVVHPPGCCRPLLRSGSGSGSSSSSIIINQDQGGDGVDEQENPVLKAPQDIMGHRDCKKCDTLVSDTTLLQLVHRSITHVLRHPANIAFSDEC